MGKGKRTQSIFYHCWLHLFISLTLGFSSLLVQVFLFHHRFLLLFLGCFHLTKFLTINVFLSSTSFLCCCTASATDLRELFLLSGIFYLTRLPHICHSTISAMDLRAFFTLSCFLLYTPSQYLVQPAFIKASLGAGSSSLKVAGPPIEVWNTDPAHLFVWITQCSAKGISP